MDRNEIINLIRSCAVKNKIDADILQAIVATESNYNPFAIRFEPNYKYMHDVLALSKYVCCTYATMRNMQMNSYGLVQLMGANAYVLGFKGWATELCNPEINLEYGCKFLTNLIASENLTTAPDIYAAFNAGSVRKIAGDYVNAEAIKKFMRNLTIIKEKKC